MGFREDVMVETGQCVRCERLHFQVLLYRSINTALVNACADYERRLAPAQPISVLHSPEV